MPIFIVTAFYKHSFVEVGYVIWSRWSEFGRALAAIFILIDDSTKGGLTQFWELFTMSPCAPKYLKR